MTSKRLPANTVRPKEGQEPEPQAEVLPPPPSKSITQAERLQKGNALFAAFLEEIGREGLALKVVMHTRNYGSMVQVEPELKIVLRGE